MSNANYGTKDELAATLAAHRAEDEVREAVSKAQWDVKVGLCQQSRLASLTLTSLNLLFNAELHPLSRPLS